MRILKDLRNFIADEKGGITTLELIGYTILIGGAVALVGFGFSAISRGKMGALTGDIQNIEAMDEPIDENSGYGYSSTTSGTTGIITEAEGN